ncbi:MAG: hypothetical protein KKB05_03600 [Proteobacteria bacterium]|nr:hypothetical protein [Pseudomonadota bacterium]MBU4463010.1 hypothetical protein [Pseudomonadota bacterium]
MLSIVLLPVSNPALIRKVSTDYHPKASVLSFYVSSSPTKKRVAVNKNRNPLYFSQMVGDTGFEPVTSTV